MATKQLEILSIEQKKSKAGNAYHVCQCVVRGLKDGQPTIKVGELMVFNKDLQLSTGLFTAEFDVTVNFERQVTSELISLVPLRTAPAAPVAPRVS